MSLSKLLAVGLAGVWLLAGCATRPDDGSRFRIKDQGKWGFINAAGTVVIPPTFDDTVASFSEGLAPVQVGKKWGYIDVSGKLIISPQFDGAQPFRDGLAAVRVGQPFEGQGKYGYIDRSGRIVLEPNDIYGYEGFASGLMPAKVGGKWGFVNRQGTFVIPARFKMANGFSEGLAWVQGDHESGFIDPSGTLVIRLKADDDGYSGFHEGLAAVRDAKTAKFGFIDSRGQWAIAPRFDDADSFAGGLAAVCIVSKDDTGWPIRKWGFVDKAGHLAIPPQFDHVGSFAQGLARVDVNKMSGFVDRQGKLVIPCQFDFAGPFSGGLAQVNVGGYGNEGWQGYIDKAGRFVWRPSNHRELDAARLAKENRTPTIAVFTEPGRDGKGLQIRWPRKVPATGPKAGQFPITVVNLLEEEVFLAVSGFDNLGGWLDTPGGGFVMSGGGIIAFPDNTDLLKRLHASTWRDSKSLTCGCALAWIDGKLSPQLQSAGRARGHVDVILHGFYRNTGKSFCESVELPVEIVEQADPDEPPATGPATKPTSRP